MSIDYCISHIHLLSFYAIFNLLLLLFNSPNSSFIMTIYILSNLCTMTHMTVQLFKNSSYKQILLCLQ
jgi:hypothetical protein